MGSRYSKYFKQGFITLCLGLILSPVTANDQNIPERASISIALFKIHSNQVCVIRNTSDYSIPICFTYEPELWELLNQVSGNVHGLKDYVSLCPEEANAKTLCSSVIVNGVNMTNFQPPALEFQHHSTQPLTPDPEPLYELWHELVVTNMDETHLFFKRSVDDVVEDFFAIVLTTGSAALLSYVGVPTLALIPLTFIIHSHLSQWGDDVSDFLEEEKEHQSTDTYSGVLVSNIVENGVKYLYYKIKLWGVTSMTILFQFNQIRAQFRDLQHFSLYSWVTVCAVGVLEITREVFSCFSNYNWINRRSDQLGDYAKEWVHYLQGHSTRINRGD